MLWSDLERFGTWDPWREFERMRRQVSKTLAPPSAEFPAINVWTAADGALVTTEIPGIEPKDIEISLVGRTLSLRGSRTPEELKDGETYHRKERWYGKFTRAIDLPYAIQADKVTATFAKGVLTITLPRAEAEKLRKIEIK